MKKFFLKNTFNFSYKIKLILISILTVFFFTIQKSQASHAFGGELTWRCTANGEFIFTMKFYRDCNGISAQSSILLQTTVPGLTTINLTLVNQVDISNNGLYSDGITLCPDCPAGGIPAVPGITEEFTYESAPVVLNGVPPANGWLFSWGQCCRSNALSNITGGGGLGSLIRAVMYPYLGTGTNPCFDSSPYFTESPVPQFCTNLPIKYENFAVDPDMDSLVYSWGETLDEVGTVLPYVPGYSLTSPYPSTIQNPLNTAATIDSKTGEVSFHSYTGGYFLTCIKVTAYKCGIKVAEVFREITVTLNNNCQPITGNLPNNPPQMNAPFADPVTGLMTAYQDTVYAGDTVNFVLNINDLEFFTNGLAQTISIEGAGEQFGTNFTNPNSGCLLPPCATLNPSLPTSFILAGALEFNWVTSCNHVTGINTQCVTKEHTYRFIIKAKDNYCPANGFTIAHFSITVLGVPIALNVAGSYNCADDTLTLNASGATSYLWNTGDTTSSIIVTQPGTYSVTGINSASCVGESNSFVFAPGVLQNVQASAAVTTHCINSSATTLSGSPSGGTWTGPGVSGNQFDPSLAGAGIHSVIYSITDSLGCSGTDSLLMIVNLCTGINETDNSPSIVVYPNPATDQIFLAVTGWNTSNAKISIYNVYGQRVSELFSGKITEQNWNHSFDISALSKGVYFIEVKGENVKTMVLRVVK